MTPDTAQAALLWARENPDAILRHAFALPTYADEIALRDAMWQMTQHEAHRAFKMWGYQQCSANIGKPDTVRMRVQLLLDVMEERRAPMTINEVAEALGVSRSAAEHTVNRGAGEGDFDFAAQLRKDKAGRNTYDARVYWPTDAEWGLR